MLCVWLLLAACFLCNFAYKKMLKTTFLHFVSYYYTHLQVFMSEVLVSSSKCNLSIFARFCCHKRIKNVIFKMKMKSLLLWRIAKWRVNVIYAWVFYFYSRRLPFSKRCFKCLYTVWEQATNINQIRGLFSVFKHLPKNVFGYLHVALPIYKEGTCWDSHLISERHSTPYKSVCRIIRIELDPTQILG